MCPVGFSLTTQVWFVSITWALTTQRQSVRWDCIFHTVHLADHFIYAWPKQWVTYFTHIHPLSQTPPLVLDGIRRQASFCVHPDGPPFLGLLGLFCLFLKNWSWNKHSSPRDYLSAKQCKETGKNHLESMLHCGFRMMPCTFRYRAKA